MWTERTPASAPDRKARDSVTAMGRHRTALAPVSGPIVSAGISVVIAVIYLGIVVRQDQRVSARSVFVASLLVAIAIALVASFRVASSEGRAALLAVGAN